MQHLHPNCVIISQRLVSNWFIFRRTSSKSTNKYEILRVLKVIKVAPNGGLLYKTFYGKMTKMGKKSSQNESIRRINQTLELTLYHIPKSWSGC